jgi:hypothetical protein
MEIRLGLFLCLRMNWKDAKMNELTEGFSLKEDF